MSTKVFTSDQKTYKSIIVDIEDYQNNCQSNVFSNEKIGTTIVFLRNGKPLYTVKIKSKKHGEVQFTKMKFFDSIFSEKFNKRELTGEFLKDRNLYPAVFWYSKSPLKFSLQSGWELI